MAKAKSIAIRFTEDELKTINQLVGIEFNRVMNDARGCDGEFREKLDEYLDKNAKILKKTYEAIETIERQINRA